MQTQICRNDANDDTSAYVDKIEERRQKNIVGKSALGHMAGYGSPCLKCGSACSGLDLHYWRKICKVCKCSAESHSLEGSEDPGKLRIDSLFDSVFRDRLTKLMSDIGGIYQPLLTDPSGQSHSDYSSQLKSKSDIIPSSLTESNRREALERQIPQQDFTAAVCHELNANEMLAHSEHVANLKEACGVGLVHNPEVVFRCLAAQPALATDGTLNDSVKVAQKETGDAFKVPASEYVCQRCNKDVPPGELAVFATRLGMDVLWHSHCFVCCICNELLADLLYFEKDRKIYCGRHYGDSIYSRCAGCDELIFENQFTKADNKDWHVKHFCCTRCDKTLADQRYMSKNELPYCLDCYAVLFAKSCQACGEKILADVQRVSHNDLHWHATADCFKCRTCQSPLLDTGKKFVLKDSLVYCDVECRRRAKAAELALTAARVETSV